MATETVLVQRTKTRSTRSTPTKHTMSSQQTPPRLIFGINVAIRALASVAVGALVFGLVFGLRRDKTTTTDRVVARPASAAAKQRPPNLIVFLADDLGRNDVGYAHRDGSLARSAKGGNYKGCFHVPRALLMCAQLAAKFLAAQEEQEQ